ncbi:MAG: hypothetical protein HQM16_05200 [Deltaproteobacteria bacterium]|nr:hypothetical protein [Deltaproteobacteria bacterium]
MIAGQFHAALFKRSGQGGASHKTLSTFLTLAKSTTKIYNGRAMFSVLAVILVLPLVSLVSFLLKNEIKKSAVACLGTSLAAGSGLILLFVPFFQQPHDNVLIPTNIPLVSFAFGVDALSRFFLVVIFGLSFLVGIYGFGYIKEHKKFVNSSPFFSLLVAAMAGVVISKDGLSFLIIWELMSIVSFFLVTAEHENKEVQNAGWIYLIATHLATAFLMMAFVMLSKSSGSLMFGEFVLQNNRTPFLNGLLFIFAVIGFGTKAGIFPFHVWLPHAHPAAPSYISALMSGVMIKTGIYGILRMLTFLGSPPLWWGETLVVIGVVSAVMGVLYALMQHDLKRLLAYHSVENIGIIVTGIGIGLIGVSLKNNMMAVLGFSGAILHVLNHAIFKGLLFLCAGNVMYIAHTLTIDILGGMIKKTPFTAMLFLIAAMSICGLPPFNGFISEWLVYTGLFNGILNSLGHTVLISIAGVLGIALAGGLAVACFTKVFGVVFLGESRSGLLQGSREPPGLLLSPMIILAVLCLFIGIFPWPFLNMVFGAMQIMAPGAGLVDSDHVMSPLVNVSTIFVVLIVLAGLMISIRSLVFKKKQIQTTVTWDCGYAHPTPRMQYTAASFAEPIGSFFQTILRPHVHRDKTTNVFFPEGAVFDEHVPDYAEYNFFEPLFKRIGSIIIFIQSKKKSTVQSYLTLIFITLIILFVAEVWFGI